MNFEKTIQYMYDEYPSLFQERWQALNQLFCVIGNGYDWIDGQLVSDDGKNVDESQIILGNNNKATPREDKIKEKIVEYYNKRKVKVLEERKDFADLSPEILDKLFPLDDEKLMKKAENFVTGKSLRAFFDNEITFYPLSEYSAIFTIPENVKPDWLEGIKEVIKLLLEHGHGYTKEEKMNDWQKEEQTKWTERLLEFAKTLEV